jgi:hypothetical protein
MMSQFKFETSLNSLTLVPEQDRTPAQVDAFITKLIQLIDNSEKVFEQTDETKARVFNMFVKAFGKIFNDASDKPWNILVNETSKIAMINKVMSMADLKELVNNAHNTWSNNHVENNNEKKHNGKGRQVEETNFIDKNNSNQKFNKWSNNNKSNNNINGKGTTNTLVDQHTCPHCKKERVTHSPESCTSNPNSDNYKKDLAEVYKKEDQDVSNKRQSVFERLERKPKVANEVVQLDAVADAIKILASGQHSIKNYLKTLSNGYKKGTKRNKQESDSDSEEMELTDSDSDSGNSSKKNNRRRNKQRKRSRSSNHIQQADKKVKDLNKLLDSLRSSNFIEIINEIPYPLENHNKNKESNSIRSRKHRNTAELNRVMASIKDVLEKYDEMKNRILIDSGTNSTVTNNKSFLREATVRKVKNLKVKAANGTNMRVHVQGTADIPVINDTKLEMEETLYLPDVKSTLVSVSQLVKHPLCKEITFDKTGCYLIERLTGNRLMIATLKDGLYVAHPNRERK